SLGNFTLDPLYIIGSKKPFLVAPGKVTVFLVSFQQRFAGGVLAAHFGIELDLDGKSVNAQIRNTRSGKYNRGFSSVLQMSRSEIRFEGVGGQTTRHVQALDHGIAQGFVRLVFFTVVARGPSDNTVERKKIPELCLVGTRPGVAADNG